MRSDSGLAALVLAAGYSSRMTGYKPLLPLGDSTVIGNVIQNFLQAGVGNITVVAGHRAEELLPMLARLGVRPVINEHYAEGMFSSVVTGVRSLSPKVEAFFLLPADMPLVRSRTVRVLGRAYKKTGADIIYPVFQGLRGHPPLISARLIPAISAGNSRGGLRLLLEEYESGAYEVEVLDEGILKDIDTPADYQETVECHGNRHIPTPNECDAIMKKLNVPDMVVRHSRLVADVAGKIAQHLNQAGQSLDTGLVEAAGLLHDLAKGRPDHARCGARVLKRLGYPRVAEIVTCHTDIILGEGLPVDEAAVLYLADKLVKHDRIVSINERFQCSLEKFAADAAALSAVAGRLANARCITKMVEQALGTDLGTVVTDRNILFKHLAKGS